MKKSIMHPILFSIFPVLSFYCANQQNYPMKLIFVLVVLSVLFSILSYLMFCKILKNKPKSALLVSLFLLLFYSYGHFYTISNGGISELVESIFGDNIIYTEKIILSAWMAIFILGAYFCLIKIRDIPKNVTVFLNITAIFLVLAPVIEIAAYGIKTIDIQYGGIKETPVKTNLPDSSTTAKTPDIYYIILDGYGRADILDEVYNHKNDKFLSYLARKGFYVAEESRSNYGQTALSLTSALNMQYLDNVIPRIGVDFRDRKILKGYLVENKVADFLRQRGYRFVTFSSGYFATEIQEADIYLGSIWSLNEFYRGLIESTALLLLRPFQSPLQEHQRNILSTFEALEKLPECKSPIFAFVHITTPHPPFVFNSSGKILNQSQMYFPREFEKDASHLIKNRSDQRKYLKSYSEQLVYVNEMVMKSIDSILADSKSPPIVILQSDHGPGAYFDLEELDNSYIKERFSILNCFYMPDGGSKNIYQGITPVNSFRVIFNHYFGTKYKKLEDRSFYSTWSHPFHFIDVTEHLDSPDFGSFVESRRLNLGLGNEE